MYKHHHVLGGCYYCDTCRASIDPSDVWALSTPNTHRALGVDHAVRRVPPWEPCPSEPLNPVSDIDIPAPKGVK